MKKKYVRYAAACIVIVVIAAGVYFLKYGIETRESQPVITAYRISDTAINERPNIIVILADDIGFDAIACNGNQSFKTPNIDNMAKAGMRFNQCHASPLCSPSRFMFVTGKYNFRNFTEWGVMNPKEKTFANILKDGGYTTYVAGKWQLDGGDQSIRNFGFDDYIVWDPLEHDTHGSIYKNPRTYQNAKFATKEEANNKFGDDIFTSHILSFIQKNKNKPFFVYYPLGLCHPPFTPTPDDPEFATWVSSDRHSDSSFFPSMMQYMDKKVGQIIDSVKAWQLYDNTIIMFIGDNGTPKGIYYKASEKNLQGAKGITSEAGTKVPFFLTWPNKIKPAQVNNSLIDFTDFVPTLADIAGLKIAPAFGAFDGQSFYGQLTGQDTTKRDWIFCHFNANNNGKDKTTRWIQDTTYKLYDVTGTFFNITTDPEEKNPLSPTTITPAEKLIKNKFQTVMNGLK